MPHPIAIEIRPLTTPEDALAFRTLNEEWITRHFVLEPKDIATLADPYATILARGGHIFLAHAAPSGQAQPAASTAPSAPGEPETPTGPIGCVALIPMGEGVYELSKMAVSPSLRGHGIGRLLVEHTIAQARALGAASLFLGSSTKLPSAVHLYESAGFRHVPPESIPKLPYARANVFMQLAL